MELKIQIDAHVVAYSDSFVNKEGTRVEYHKYTLRVGGQLVDVSIRGVVDPGKYLDKDVVVECEVYPAKSRAAALRVVGVEQA